MPAATLESPVPDLAEMLSALGLTEAEYRKIVNHLGREPNVTELAMFSVLWSEHCCYKNSRHLLKLLPTTGPCVLHGPGENAGVVDIGDGIQIAFKVESHNHPTAVEPYQGAATGVGGILRDIFTMNARPIAGLNALRFGPPDSERNAYLLRGAVKGIGDYGNCVGVPTIGGEVFFDDCYGGNPLVNAMAIGVLYDNAVMSARAAGPGNPVLYVGSATGRDGMGGAAFASRELDEKSAEDRPAVQVGDPFAEKLLIEACLEAFATGCVVAAQDMGAAGLTSSACEMAAKGDVGIDLDLDRVPAREPGMAAHEYLLSESQERMLFVLARGREQPVLDVFAKWRIPAVVIGEITQTGHVRILHGGETVADVPARLLTDLAPSYDRGKNPPEPETARARRTKDAFAGLPPISIFDVLPWLEKLLASPNIARPIGIFSQYDRHVQNNTLLASENLGSGVVRLRKADQTFSGKAIAATLDCNARHVWLEPYAGSMSAVAQAARNLVCVGAEPIAVTDNLNFGNPERPEIYYQLYYAVQGIADACRALDTPVISGNVSLYNERSGRPIFPTPVIGMVGLISDETKIMSPSLKRSGEHIARIGRFKPAFGGSEYQKLWLGDIEGAPPDIDLNHEKQCQALMLKLIRDGLVTAVQDVSLGGLLPTLAEMSFAHAVGIDLDLDALCGDARFDLALFGETNGTYLVAYRPEDEPAIRACCAPVTEFCPFAATMDGFALRLGPDPGMLSVPLAPLKARWSTSLVV